MLAAIFTMAPPAFATPVPSVVIITDTIPGRPVGTRGETFFSHTLLVGYSDDSVLLAANPAGTAAIAVDDEVEIIVTHPDGSTARRTFNFVVGICSAIASKPPQEVGDLFQNGTNRVDVIFRDVCGVSEGASDFYLVGVSPVLRLPWSSGQTWFYSSGPHCDAMGAHCRTGAVRYAVDFMPAGHGCNSTREQSGWVTAAAAGVVRESGSSLVEIDHGGGFRTGYYHLRSSTIVVGSAQVVRPGQNLGRPSCEVERDGHATGTHVHLYICHQPDRSSICGPFATNSAARSINDLLISGWTIHALPLNHDGTMTKPGEETRIADKFNCVPGATRCQGIRNDLISDNTPL